MDLQGSSRRSKPTTYSILKIITCINSGLLHQVRKPN